MSSRFQSCYTARVTAKTAGAGKVESGDRPTAAWKKLADRDWKTLCELAIR